MRRNTEAKQKGRDMWCRNSADDEADGIERLLEEYGHLCRTKGLDPRSGSARGSAHESESPAGSLESGSSLRHYWSPRLGWGLAAVGLMVVAFATQWNLGLQHVAPFVRNAPRSGSAATSMSDVFEAGGERSRANRSLGTRSTVPMGDPWVEVAAMPDLPPTIQVLQAGQVLHTSRNPRRPRGDVHSTAGGGLLQTDVSCLLDL